jgi:hypothetical protein
MTALNHLLGAVAKINLALWRYRVNFVPMNVALLIGLAAIGIASTNSVLDGMRNSEAPAPLTIDQVGANAVTQNYVTISGVAVPEAVYEYGKKGSDGNLKSVSKSWFPLVDPQNRRAVLVQHAGKLESGQPRQASITGMLRDIDASLRDNLARENFTIDGFAVDPRYMLVEGDDPGNPWLHVAIVALVIVLLAAAAIAVASRHTIFRAAGGAFRAPEHIDASQPSHVRASGLFALTDKVSQRFVDIPAVLGLHDRGPFIAANIDASSRFMGVKTRERSGTWVISVKPGSVSNEEFGYMFFGLSRRPACRFAYVSAADAKPQTAIVAANDERAVHQAIALLRAGQPTFA